jgi:hypothetical protein
LTPGTSDGQLRHWIWFLAGIEPGQHDVRIEAEGFVSNLPLGVYLRGDMPAPPPLAPFDGGPAFPLYRPLCVPWSRVLVPVAARGGARMNYEL